jgi:hypothetical protein
MDVNEMSYTRVKQSDAYRLSEIPPTWGPPRIFEMRGSWVRPNHSIKNWRRVHQAEDVKWTSRIFFSFLALQAIFRPDIDWYIVIVWWSRLGHAS